MIALVGLLLAAASPPGVTIRDLVELADISSVAVSPDATQVAFRVERPSIERNATAVAWYVVPLDGRAPARRLAEGGLLQYDSAGVAHVEPPVWSRDGRTLYFRATWHGETQVWGVALASGVAAPRTADPGDVVDFALSDDGRRLRYRAGPLRARIAGAEAEARERGVLVDASVDLALGASGGVRIDGRHISQRLTGDWFERRGLLGQEPLRTAEIALPEAVTNPPSVGPTSSGASAVPQACSRPTCAQPRAAWTARVPGSSRVLEAQRDAFGRETLYLADSVLGARLLVARSDGLLSGGRDPTAPCAVAARVAVCVAASAESPPQLVRVALDGSGTTSLFDPNGGLRLRIPGPVRRISWTDREGQGFSGFLIEPRPSHEPRRPALVIHYYRCDGFLRGGTGDELPIYPLVDAGIAVLCINAPSVARPGQDAQANYRLALSGIDAIVDRLAREGQVDPARVGMQGLSFGSEATMWVLRHSVLLKAASIASAQLEPSYYWFNAGAGRDVPAALARIWKIGPPDQDAEGWHRVSAARDFESIKAPLLMQLPELEARWSIELYARLSRSRTPAELVVYPGARHIKTEPRQKEAVYHRNLDWFRFWLDGQVDPGPAKAPQYTRWRAFSALGAGGDATGP